MNTTAVRRPSPGGKPAPIRRELVDELWADWVKARGRAMRSAEVKDGIAAGHAWAAFLAAFERMDGG